MSDAHEQNKKKRRATRKDGDKKDFLLVGIGASAGGIKALKEFFALMPPDSGMAFVVILHLSQEFESNLAQILQRETEMPVEQITETVKVEPNRVYVIPPAKHLEMVDGVIALKEPQRVKGVRVPIDRFFRSLAEAYGRRAISVILSGTGTDGTLGMKHVKGRDGFAIVQDPLDAEYDGMPRSAIETRIADVILPVAEMPEKLLFVRDSTERLRLTDGQDGEVAKEIKNIELLRDVLTLLRVRTGHDFSNYKRPTLVRRIARHLQIHETDDLEVYLKILREKPDEVLSLLKNLLINVTNFFRDKEAFAALEKKVIPALFEGKKAEDQVRVWSAGCASGEEAYSMAILLSEYAATLPDPPKIQVFASDVDDDAIAEAREGRFTEAVVSDVSPERLSQFFIKEDDGYRIRKQVREMILFAPHNILRDPPFSKLDLVSCRNVLIYLNRDTQEKVLQVFHFALRENGYLFLGSAESAESIPQNFSSIDKKHRIYQCQPSVAAFSGLPPQMPVEGAWLPKIIDYPAKTRDNLQSFGELHHRLIEHYAPPSILVNEEGDILHLSETAGRFLRFTGGQPSVNLLKVIHPDLLSDLRAALFAARQDKKTVEAKNIRVNFEGAERLVNLTVRPLNLPEAAALVMLEDSAASEQPQTEESVQAIVAGDKAVETVLKRMEDELRQTKDRLRTTAEQYETTLEEQKASNEELQAINEELRSASEELETGKEELQSLNEELTTVNHELKDKIDETTRINSDLQNLMQSTNIATIFLDRELKIKRFTPPVTKIFNIIASDIGRPLGHLTHRLSPDDFQADAAEALQTLKTIEREVVSNDNRVFLARIAPYRTIDDKIDGAVLAFIDITKIKQAERDVRESEEKYRTLFDSIDEGVTTLEVIFDENEKVVDWRMLETNPATTKMTGWSSETVGKLASEYIPGGIEPFWFDAAERVVKTGEPIRIEHPIAGLNDSWYEMYVARVGGADSRIIVAVYNNITERKRREANQTLLVEIVADLSRLVTPDEIMQAVGSRIGQHLRLGTCVFADVNEDRGDITVHHGWDKGGVSSLKETYRFEDYVTDEFARGSHANELWIIRDTANDPRVNGDALNRLNVGAWLAVPFHREGRWTAHITVTDTAPRDWREDEIEFVRTVADLIFPRIERARAEEALRENRMRLEFTLEAAKGGDWDLDLLTGKAVTSLRHDQCFGATEPIPDWSYEKFLTYVHPDDRENEARKFQAAVASGEDWSIDCRVVWADGSVHWIESSGRNYAYVDGKPMRMLGMVREVTERKRHEANLAFLAEVSQDLARLTNIDETMATLSRKIGNYFKVSRVNFAEINEAAGEAVITHDWRTEGLADISGNRVHRLGDFIAGEFFRAARTGEIIVVGDTRLDSRTTDAAYTPLNTRAFVTAPFVRNGQWLSLMSISDSEPHAWQADEIELMREITGRIWTRLERARAEEALTESEERFRLFVTSAAAQIIYRMSADWSEMYFLEGKDFIADTENSSSVWLEEYIPDDDKALTQATIREAVRTKTPFELEHRVIRADGRIGWVLSRAVPLLDEQGEIVEWFGTANDITPRKDAEERLRESEENYRTLFESIDEGFCTIEVIFDEKGKPIDYRFLETNPVFERQTGLENAAGKTIRELIPELEQFWFETYGRIAKTGEAERFEHEAAALRRFYDVYAFRIGASGENRVAVIFNDITQRKRTESNLAFLAEVTQDLSRLTNLDATMNALGEKIAAHFGLSACAFAELDETAAVAVFNYGWHRKDVPSLLGTYRMEEFMTTEIVENCRAGETVIVRDVSGDARFDGEQYAALNIGSFVSTPLVRGGKWQFLLVVYRTEPYNWTDDEIELLREIANRIWTRLERARAEAALREKEAELEAITNETPFMLTRCTADLRYRYVSRAYAAMINRTPEEINGKPIVEVMGEKGWETIAPHVERVLQGERVEYEDQVDFHSDGAPYLHVVYTPDTDETGKVNGWFASIVDITETKRAEEALRESEQRLRRMVNVPRVGVLTFNFDGDLLHANDAFVEMVGYDREHFDAHAFTWRDFTPPEYVEESERIMEQLRETGRGGPYEKEYLRSDGSRAWLMFVAADLGDGTIIEYAVDISDRKRAEQSLLESEERLRLAAEAAEMYSWEFDAGSATYKFSKNAPQILGIAPGNLPETVEDTFKLVHPDDRELIRQTLERALQTGEGFTLDLRSVRQNGEVIWLGVQTTVLKDAQGKAARIIGIAQNITERKQAEENLRESEQRLRLATEAGELGTWEWNLATGEVFWNERHFTLFGMKPRPNPLQAGEFFNHVHEDDLERVREQLEKAVKEKTIFQAEFRSRLESGDVRWMNGYGQAIEIGAGGETVKMSGVMFDVTEIKRAEDAVREKENLRRIIKAQEMERKRIAQDLHDHLGQQLTALRLKLELLRQTCGSDEKTHRQVDETQAIAQQIDSDIDFLSWEMRPSALDDIGLAAALENYVREWTKNFAVEADFRVGDFGGQRFAPETETNLYRIAQEAMNNIAKHARANHVDISLERRDGFVVLIVEDDGIGFVVDEQKTKSIGLIGMRERAALIGGTVQIETAPGEGTTVYVRVPLAEENEKEKNK